MSKSDEDNPFVSKVFCDERFKRVETMYNNIDRKLEEIRVSNRAWKTWLLGIASSIITGLIVAFIVGA